MMGLFGTLLVSGRVSATVPPRQDAGRAWLGPTAVLASPKPAADAAVARLAGMVGADRNCPGHAVARQLPYLVCKKGASSAPA